MGLYDRLMVELRNENPRPFQNFMRMPPATYDEIVQRVTPGLPIETANLKAPFEPGLKVAITLMQNRLVDWERPDGALVLGVKAGTLKTRGLIEYQDATKMLGQPRP